MKESKINFSPEPQNQKQLITPVESAKNTSKAKNFYEFLGGNFLPKGGTSDLFASID